MKGAGGGGKRVFEEDLSKSPGYPPLIPGANCCRHGIACSLLRAALSPSARASIYLVSRSRLHFVTRPALFARIYSEWHRPCAPSCLSPSTDRAYMYVLDGIPYFFFLEKIYKPHFL